ncbi:hypothetical protein G3Q00_004295 [Escherichia coli]|nr:hypothetical protein [Escherichia coli]
MCIEMCIGLILEHVEMALLLVSWLVVLFPSPLQNLPRWRRLKKSSLSAT